MKMPAVGKRRDYIARTGDSVGRWRPERRAHCWNSQSFSHYF